MHIVRCPDRPTLYESDHFSQRHEDSCKWLHDCNDPATYLPGRTDIKQIDCSGIMTEYLFGSLLPLNYGFLKDMSYLFPLNAILKTAKDRFCAI